MKKLIILIMFLIFPLSLLSEWEWEMLMEDVYGITLHEEIMYIGTDDGIKKSTDNGDTWEHFALDTTFIFLIHFNQDEIFAVGRNQFFYSTDKGNTWSLQTMPEENTSFDNISFYDDIIYAVSDSKFYISGDNGLSWKRSLQPTHSGLYSVGVDDIGNIYLGAMGAHINTIYVSTDGGENWEERTNGLKFRSNIIWQIYTSGDSVFAVTYGGVFLSTNQGHNWYEVGNSHAITFLFYSNILFYGHDLGLYYSIGDEMTIFGTGLKEIISVISVNEITNTLFAIGYHYDSNVSAFTAPQLYRASLDDIVSVEDNITLQHTLIVLPNPAGDIMHIENGNPNSAIEIYSVLGIVQMKLPYSTSIDVSRLPTGVYFLRSGSEVASFVK